MSSRAFALPTVMILVLVAGVMLGVMLERNVGQMMLAKRQYDSYGFMHATRGIGEAVDAWIKHNGAGSIADALDPTGLAFDLEPEGSGSVVHVALLDGQGLILGDVSGLTGETLESGREILRSLTDLQGAEARRFVRKEGPLAVSVNSAPAEVLEAVLDAALRGESSSELLAQLEAERGGDRAMEPERLTEMIDQSHVPDEAKPRLKALLTANPVLWRVRARSESRATGVEGVEYRAWAVLSRTARSSGADRASQYQRGVSVFGWERVEDR